MYKVLLVDDERFIRKSIRNRVDWGKLGLSVEGEASNGVEALEMLELLRPQIVLVDIRMPLMDGLALIAEAQKRYPGIRYVITSAYSDFAYAKKAIQLGVEDYILKPIDEQELEKLLTRLVHEIDEMLLAHRLKEQVLAGQNSPKMKGSRIAAIAFYVKESEGMDGILAGNLREKLVEEGRAELFYLREYSCGECYVFLVNDDRIKEEQLRDAVEAVWERIGAKKGAASWSDAVEETEIERAAGQAVRRLKRKIFCPGKKLLPRYVMAPDWEAKKAQRDARQTKIREAMNSVYQHQMKDDYKMMEAELWQLPELIVHPDNTISVIEAAISELVILFRRIMGGQGDETESKILFHGVTGKDYLLRFETQEELKEALTEIIDGVLRRYGRKEEQGIVDRVRAYIRDNYGEDLSTTELAGLFFLNSKYLSAVFKEKTGMNLTAYIEAVRMEKAKQLLRDGRLSVSEAALHTGYSDPNYFSKVFKRYTGLSPKLYREDGGKSEGNMIQ